MQKKAKLLAGLLALVIIALNVLLLTWHPDESASVTFGVTVRSDVSDNVQVFAASGDQGFGGAGAVSGYEQSDVDEGREVEMTFSVDANVSRLRIDLGSKAGTWRLTNPYFLSGRLAGHVREDLAIGNLALTEEENDIVSLKTEGDSLVVETADGDPYFAVPAESLAASDAALKAVRTKNLIIRILMLLLVDGAAAALVIFRKKLLTLPVELYENRKLIMKLARNDFKTKYAGSYLGIFWAFVQPVVTILVYWFVFSVGFRSGSVMDVPFVVYLVSGLVPWFYIQDFMNSGTNALIEYSYLVKKVVFKISVLPMVKAISAFFVHAFFVFITVVICLLYRINPGLYIIQVVYYFFAMFVFGLGIVYGTCAVVIFFRDLSQIINIILQIGVWTIPIMWQLGQVPAKLHWIFKINPMYYIITGYRESMYGHVWFWEHMGLTAYFWIVTLALFLLGTVIFKRLKVHFADVL